MACKSKNRRARRLRLYRRGTGAAVAAPSAGRDRIAYRRPARRQADGGGVSAVLALCAADADGDRGRRLEGAGARSGVLRAAARHDAKGHQGSDGAGAGYQSRRSLGRFPAGRSRRLCTLVRPRAFRARTAERRRLRTGRGLSGQDQDGEACRQSRLLHHLRRTGADPALESQGHRSGRDRHRRQVRHDGRGPDGARGDAVFGSVRGLSCLRRRPSPPHVRARPGVLLGRRPRRDRDASRRIWCR